MPSTRMRLSLQRHSREGGNPCGLSEHECRSTGAVWQWGRAARTIERVNTPSQRRIRRRRLELAALAGAIVFFGYDLAVDVLLEGEFGSLHFIIESIVFVGISAALVIGTRDLRSLRESLRREEERNRAFSGELAAVIDERMEEWRLTRSEKDVAWMIIKGYRFTEIAEARGVKESTCRLQATSLYAKAGVSGRAEFVAEIIQPLLMSIPNESSPRKEKPPVRLVSR